MKTLFALVLFMPVFARGIQDVPEHLAPSESLKAAMAPIEATRSQPDDLTDADRIALQVGIARAGESCLALQLPMKQLAANPGELLALGRLCLFGKRYQEAQIAIVKYIQATPPNLHEEALILLSQAYLGLNSSANAEAQIFSLLRDFPFDADIDSALTQVVRSSSLAGSNETAAIMQLCDTHLTHTLPLLDSGKGLSGSEQIISTNTLFSDDVRCLDILHAKKSDEAAVVLKRLTTFLDEASIKDTAAFLSMRSSLDRYTMLGRRLPLSQLKGQLLTRSEHLVPFSKPLSMLPLILVPTTTWSPAINSVLTSLNSMIPESTTILITSWAANSGGADNETPEGLRSLCNYARSLPVGTSLIVVPNSTLLLLHADVFPAGVVLRNGFVEANTPMTSTVEIRVALESLRTDDIYTSEAPRSTNNH